ncbi:MAG: hypothetical protein R6V10_11530 [bacterium]
MKNRTATWKKRSKAAAAGLVLALLSALLVFTGCGPLPDPAGNMDSGGAIPRQDDTSADPRHYAAFVAATDYSISGGFGVIDLDDYHTYSPDPAWAAEVISPDPVAKSYGDYVFVLNRYTYDSISVLRKKDFSLKKQYSVADGSCDPSNPHDLEFVSESKAYLSRYECRDLWIINPVTGEKLGSIDLGAYGGKDGIPEMSGMELVGSTLYVAVQMLERESGWTAPDHSMMVVIDTTTDSVVADIELTGSNPVTDVLYSDSLSSLVVGSASSPGSYNDPNGGIEAVDPVTNTSAGFLISESALAGNVADFEVLNSTRAYATIDSADFRSKLVAFNPQTGVREQGSVYQAEKGYALWDIALSNRGQLLVCDRSAKDPGVVIIDTTAADKVLGVSPIDLGLPPFSIALLK